MPSWFLKWVSDLLRKSTLQHTTFAGFLKWWYPPLSIFVWDFPLPSSDKGVSPWWKPPCRHVVTVTASPSRWPAVVAAPLHQSAARPDSFRCFFGFHQPKFGISVFVLNVLFLMVLLMWYIASRLAFQWGFHKHQDLTDPNGDRDLIHTNHGFCVWQWDSQFWFKNSDEPVEY